MKRILCRLGFHDWEYNTLDIVVGTERVCQRKRCGRKEVYSRAFRGGQPFWYRLK